MKALGTMLPGNGAWRSAQCQRAVHSAPQGERLARTPAIGLNTALLRPGWLGRRLLEPPLGALRSPV